MNMEWIKVTDRLPSKDDASQYGDVMGYISDNVFALIAFDQIQRYSDITHWMPLPDPPKE